MGKGYIFKNFKNIVLLVIETLILHLPTIGRSFSVGLIAGTIIGATNLGTSVVDVGGNRTIPHPGMSKKNILSTDCQRKNMKPA